MPHRPREWSSYLPDGRRVQVQKLDDGWHVSCEHRSATADGLLAAIEEAVGITDHELATHASLDESLRHWIHTHAKQIEAERGAPG